ncbi:MAG: STAS domain-containing protein [Oscillospiraceae bacterium]|nr:STAS domain-containing protein [Oscillospiraceae bacterium]
MDVNKTHYEGETIYSLSGKLDTVTAPEFQKELIPEFDAAKSIIVDFTSITFVSSAGLRVLLMGEKTAKVKGASMTLRKVPDDVMEIFKKSGLARIFTIK